MRKGTVLKGRRPRPFERVTSGMIQTLQLSSFIVGATLSITDQAFLWLPRLIKIFPANQYICPKKGIFKISFLPMETVRLGKIGPTKKISKLD